MHANKKKYLSFHKDGLELLKIIHKVDSSAIPISILCALVKALYPYINIILSAYIIDLLIQRDIKNAVTFVVILISGDFVLGSLKDSLDRVNYYRQKKMGYLVQAEIRRKALKIDYETLENPKTLEKVNTAINTLRYQGGFGFLLENYCYILESLFKIITSVALVFELCFKTFEKIEGILNIANNIPMSLLIMFIFFALIIFSNFYIVNLNNKEGIKVFNNRIRAERIMAYYMGSIYGDYEKGKVTRLYDMDDLINKKYFKSNDSAIKLYGGYIKVTNLSQKVEVAISGVGLIISYLFVMIKVLAKAITIGSITKYVGAISELNAGLVLLVKSNEQVRLQCDYLKHFVEFMNLNNKRKTGTIPVEKRLDNEFEIEFHDVSFAYPGSSEMVLNNVSCKVNMKNKMAIVGKNGAGKTTFIKLITRLYDPTCGYISLNGIDIKKYDYDEYLNLFSVVFQDFGLFAFPVEENVVTNTEVEEEKVWKCLELAGVKEAVEKMKLKLKTPLFKYDDDGVECSGGEKQKLAIARALYKDAPFVILDEPTAALDPISEYEVYSRFNELVKDKTSIFISHRMSSCRFCDDIMVFDNGKIIQRGSHDELIKNNEGLYSSLWNAQASYYVEG